MVGSSQEVKRLKTRISRLSNKIDCLPDGEQRTKAIMECRRSEERLNRIQSGANDLIFSEHSIIRYLERVEGVDLDDVKDRMLTKADRNKILALGDGKYQLENGTTIVVRNNVIVTTTL